jgi:hypothetical protein
MEVVIKKVNRDFLTAKQKSLAENSGNDYYWDIDIDEVVDENLITEFIWESTFYYIMDILISGARVASKRNSNVKGKWCSINDVYMAYRQHNFKVIEQMLQLEMLDDDEEIIDENISDTLLVKYINGVAVELRFNLSEFDVLEPEILEDKYEYSGYYEHKDVIDFDSYNLNIKYKKIVFNKERADKVIDYRYETENPLENLVKYIGESRRTGLWHYYDEVNLVEAIKGCEIIEDDNIKVTDPYTIILEYIWGDLNRVRYNMANWVSNVDSELSIKNQTRINKDVRVEDLGRDEDQYDRVVESPVEEFVLPAVYSMWIQDCTDKQDEDEKYTLGDAYNIWINEYETEVVEKTSLWGSFKGFVSRSWAGFKGLFGW